MRFRESLCHGLRRIPQPDHCLIRRMSLWMSTHPTKIHKTTRMHSTMWMTTTRKATTITKQNTSTTEKETTTMDSAEVGAVTATVSFPLLQSVVQRLIVAGFRRGNHGLKSLLSTV